MEDVRVELERRTPKSKGMYERAGEVLAQEVVSTLAMPHPVYIKEAKGPHMTDVDDNEYLDLSIGFGVHILGHAPDFILEAVKEATSRGLQWGLHNAEQEQLARLIVEAAPCADKVVFANTGTEATLYALRAARAYTGKDKIAIFTNCYHGAHDYTLAMTHPDSPPDRPTFSPRGIGIPQDTQQNTIMLPYMTDAAFDLIRENKDELAAVIIEPAQGAGPRTDVGDFLKGLLDVCRESGVLLIFDEVITGFRLAYGGAQEFFDVVPDLAAYGKVLGGGMAIGAVAGSDEVMKVFPRRGIVGQLGPGQIFTGGTFVGNPISMAAGIACITHLRDHPEIYKNLAIQSNRLTDEVNRFCIAEEIPVRMENALSMLYLRFRPDLAGGPSEAESLKEAEDEFYMHLLVHGVLVPGDHLSLLSAAHTPEDVDAIIEAIKQSFHEVREKGLM